MSPSVPKTRKAPRDHIRREVAKFYGGLGCVVTKSPASKASLHHLDGDPSYYEFPNLLPLALDLHNGLKKDRVSDNLRPELSEAALKKTAEDHFKSGNLPQAYGCLRLAYALSAHFYKQTYRDLENEFQTLAHCLYFLRRSVGQHRLELVYANLQFLLEREVQATLDDRKVIPPFGAFCLLIELASWMNELGQSNLGLDLLRKGGRRLSVLQSRLAPCDISRFQRQMANALIQMGQCGAELEKALKMSSDSGDDTENNKFAIFNTLLNLHLGKGQLRQALEVLEERFEYFEQQTDYFFGPLIRMEPTIMTSLGYIALSLVSEGQLIHSCKHRQRLEDRLEALKRQEQRYGQATMLNRVPGLDRTVAKAARQLPSMQQFLDGRLFPVLPKELVESILKIAAQL